MEVFPIFMAVPILLSHLPPLSPDPAGLRAHLRPRLHPDARRALHLRPRAARVLDAGPVSTSRATTTIGSGISRRASSRRSWRARFCCGRRRCAAAAGCSSWSAASAWPSASATSSSSGAAALIGGSAATEFLGTQGDVWDTQWDMFMALIGSLLAQLTLSGLHDIQLRTCQIPATSSPVRRKPGH